MNGKNSEKNSNWRKTKNEIKNTFDDIITGVERYVHYADNFRHVQSLNTNVKHKLNFEEI